MHSLAAIPAIGLVAGSAAGLLAPDIPSALGLTALALCACAAGWALRTSRPLILSFAVGFSFFFGGTLLAADAWREAWRPPLRQFFEELARTERAEAAARGRLLPVDGGVLVVLTGVLRTDASPRPNGVSLSVASTSVGRVVRPGPPPDSEPKGTSSHQDRLDLSVHGGVLLTVVGDLAANRAGEWRAGRVVRVPAALRRPSRYLNPGAPDEERMLARRGITLVGTVKSGALVEVVARGGPAAEAAAAARALVRRAIQSAVGRWSARSAAIVTAIVIGDRAGLDDVLERRLQEAGTYHVIAISGGNIAVLAGLMLGVFRLAGLFGRAAMVTAMTGLIAYGFLVGSGGGSSVQRATFMAVVHLAGRAIDLRGPPSNTLALAAAVLVAVEPLAIADPAFLLTFGATAAILSFVPVVRTVRLPRPAVPIVLLGAASVAAEAALLPVGAFLFSRVTFAGLLLNLAAVPLMGLAQIAGMAVVPVAMLVPALAPAMGWVAHMGAEGLVRSSELVRVAPVLAWRVAPPHWIAIAAYYAGLVAAWSLWRQRARTLGGEGVARRLVRRASVATALLAAIWIVAEPWRALASRGDGRLHVTFIDVGQGDAVFVRFPRGGTLLVDAGGLPGGSSFDVGDRVVAPVLRREGVRRLDAVAFTHGDADHIGGVQSIVREFKPRDVWEGIPVPRLEEGREVRAAAEEVHARWVNVQTNDRQSIDGVEVIVRHPPIADWERQKVRNDDSIVLELVWRDVSVVLTGDIGREVERAVVPLFVPARLRVVKVAHHGSLTSSSWDFVRALAPRVAVASAGRGNTFGHPVAAVLERYRAAGAEIFRTDLDGAVTVETDGHSLDVRTFTGRQLRLISTPASHEGATITKDPKP